MREWQGLVFSLFLLLLSMRAHTYTKYIVDSKVRTQKREEKKTLSNADGQLMLTFAYGWDICTYICWFSHNQDLTKKKQKRLFQIYFFLYDNVHQMNLIRIVCVLLHWIYLLIVCLHLASMWQYRLPFSTKGKSW
jgi:hypothetical protein